MEGNHHQQRGLRELTGERIANAHFVSPLLSTCETVKSFRLDSFWCGMSGMDRSSMRESMELRDETRPFWVMGLLLATGTSGYTGLGLSAARL